MVFPYAIKIEGKLNTVYVESVVGWLGRELEQSGISCKIVCVFPSFRNAS